MSTIREAESVQFFSGQEDMTPSHGPNASNFNLSQANGRLFDPSGKIQSYALELIPLVERHMKRFATLGLKVLARECANNPI